jgi:3-oxoacyl-[acyl-carrier protein] reductase
MDLGLTGKVAVVTGGSDGIGRATAEALVREGARVLICGRRPDALDGAVQAIRDAAGGEIIGVPADVSRAEDCERIVQEATARLGPPTLLVNNAGTSAARSFELVDDAAWQADLDLKLFAAIRLARLCVPGMRAAGGGRIVNITNIGAKQPGANSVPTSVSRAAGLALTKAMSKELAKDNILVNTVCIGLIKSGQISRAARSRHPDATDLDEAFQRMGAGIPLGRVGEASEAADVITFLLSDRASYVTGVSVNVDGGTSGVL